MTKNDLKTHTGLAEDIINNAIEDLGGNSDEETVDETIAQTILSQYGSSQPKSLPPSDLPAVDLEAETNNDPVSIYTNEARRMLIELARSDVKEAITDWGVSSMSRSDRLKTLLAR